MALVSIGAEESTSHIRVNAVYDAGLSSNAAVVRNHSHVPAIHSCSKPPIDTLQYDCKNVIIVERSKFIGLRLESQTNTR